MMNLQRIFSFVIDGLGRRVVGASLLAMGAAPTVESPAPKSPASWLLQGRRLRHRSGAGRLPALFATALLAALPALAADFRQATPTGHAAASAGAPSAGTGIFASEAEALDQALEQARRDGRRGVAVLFELGDCPGCANLRRTLASPAVRRLYRDNFVTVTLHVDRSRAIRDFAGKSVPVEGFAESQRVVGTPTLVFFDLAGTPVARQAGGRLKSTDLVRLAQYVREAAYEDLPFHAWRPHRP